MMGAANPYLTQKTLEKKRFAPLIVAVCMSFTLPGIAMLFNSELAKAFAQIVTAVSDFGIITVSSSDL